MLLMKTFPSCFIWCKEIMMNETIRNRTHGKFDMNIGIVKYEKICNIFVDLQILTQRVLLQVSSTWRFPQAKGRPEASREQQLYCAGVHHWTVHYSSHCVQARRARNMLLSPLLTRAKWIVSKLPGMINKFI